VDWVTKGFPNVDRWMGGLMEREFGEDCAGGEESFAFETFVSLTMI
jgi:hypothetical protein